MEEKLRFRYDREADILHRASALILQADTFYSYDRNRKRLARTEGLKTP